MNVLGLFVSLLALVDVPNELTPFVTTKSQAVAVESADLNGDGRADYLLLLEPEDSEEGDGPRSLFIITRSADGTLRQMARSDKAVFCRGCGGMMGDPFQHIVASRNTFVITHYGGSSWRWWNEYTFKYSRRDQAWQLVRVEEGSFHTSKPDTREKKVYVPPRDYGKIDFIDFDPENYRGVGPK